MKGITPLVAVVLLLLITVSIIGFVFWVFSRTIQSTGTSGEEQLGEQISQMSTLFALENVDKNKLYIRNLGTSDLKNLSFYVDGTKIDSDNPVIAPNTVGIVTLNDSQLAMSGVSSAELRIVSAGFSDKMAADFYEENTIAYWKFDETAGSVADDASSNNNDGTINGATRTAGKYSSALSFDGIDDYVDVPNHASLTPINAITIEAWIKQHQQGDELVMKFATDWATNSYGYNLITNNDGSVSFWLGNGAYPFPSLSTGPNSFTLDEWHHIAATYDRNKMKIYVDGALKAEKSETSAIVPTSGVLFISTNWAPNYNGIIDEVRILDIARPMG